MSLARSFVPDNSLSDRLNDPRGRNLQEAVQAAQAAVLTRKPRCLEEIDIALTVLAGDLKAYRSSADPEGGFQPERAYAAADRVAALAAVFDKPRLGEAASSLCKLATEAKGARPEAIAVHIEAMLMIDKDDSLGSALLPGLRHLSDGGGQKPAAAPDAVQTAPKMEERPQ